MMYCNGTAVNGPKIGERLVRKPELGHDNIPDPIHGTVVYVNEKHGGCTAVDAAALRPLLAGQLSGCVCPE